MGATRLPFLAALQQLAGIRRRRDEDLLMRAGIGLGTRPKLTCQPLGERSRMLRWTEQTEHLWTELSTRSRG
jgi:hypothetical protein